ncbi:MAG: sugar phosphate isomerase/epimerase [Gemmatimonadaceae bacterium]|nr:sugar phosphate isomerase/epimerase [Gemmatimonadaceae bacterium]
MKLAVSNIAWKQADDEGVATMLRDAGVTGIEVAPTAVWADPLTTTEVERREYRAWWAERGFAISSMQALLFGRPELVLFGDQPARDGMRTHLVGMMDLAAALGVGPLVFGSPRNRTVGGVPRDVAQRIAIEFFRDIGQLAHERGVWLCIEPNPSAYDCDFVRTFAEASVLVGAVGEPGFGLHVDAGAMAINGEAVADTIAAAGPLIRHFHASEPFLAPLGANATDHASYADALRDAGYAGWVSLEMRAPPDGLDGLARALDVLTVHYGD